MTLEEVIEISHPKGYSPRNSAAFAQHDRQSTSCSSLADCKKSDELEKIAVDVLRRI